MAMSAARKLQKRDGKAASYPVTTGVILYGGALVVMATTGYCRPGRASTTDRVLGCVEKTVDNSGGADGAVTARVHFGVFCFKNSSAGDAITYADVGNQCYVVDDQTVAKTSNTNARIVAGRIIDVDSDGVWVDVRPGGQA